jgi:hypothetical protein
LYAPYKLLTLQNLNQKGIAVHMKLRNTLRQLLVAPKDKVQQKKTGVVYHIPCGQCPTSYIGESERALGQRLAEHHRPSCVNSPVVAYARDVGHNINWEGVCILDRDDNWFRRGVREAAHIRKEDSTLNRDGGRYHLPGVYSTSISCCLHPTTIDLQFSPLAASTI